MTEIIFAADHRGFALKEALKKYVEGKGLSAVDMGAFVLDEADDYPDFAYAGAHKVAENPEAIGIFICGSGMGMDVVANKVKGIRATVAYSPASARHARVNDDINVITLAADFFSESEAEQIVDAFIGASFSGETRHVRRVEKIRHIEAENFR